ncbi:hypothetical protein ACWENR_28520 [Micromonospora sp. NPDC004336]
MGRALSAFARHQAPVNAAMVVITTIVTVWGFYYARRAYLIAEENEQQKNAAAVAIWILREGNALNPYDTEAIRVHNRSSSAATRVSLVTWTKEQPLEGRVRDGRTVIDTHGAWRLDDLGPCTDLTMRHPDLDNDDRIGLLFQQDARAWLLLYGGQARLLEGSVTLRNKTTSASVSLHVTVGVGTPAPSLSPGPPPRGDWGDSSC